MKNKKSFKYLLSGIVLITTVVLNVNHCHKNAIVKTVGLNGVFRIASCNAELIKKPSFIAPIMYSPGNPSNGLSEEEYLRLLHRQR